RRLCDSPRGRIDPACRSACGAAEHPDWVRRRPTAGRWGSASPATERKQGPRGQRRSRRPRRTSAACSFDLHPGIRPDAEKYLILRGKATFESTAAGASARPGRVTMSYSGSCHCGKISYEVEGEIEQVIDCNCSHCSRKGYLLWFVPREKLRFKSGEEDGRASGVAEDVLMGGGVRAPSLCSFGGTREEHPAARRRPSLAAERPPKEHSE